MNPRTKQIAKFLFRMLITAVLLSLVCYQIDFQQFKQTVKTGRWEFIILVWIFSVWLFWLRCLTLKLILSKQSCNVTIRTLFRASAIASLYGMVLPGFISSGAKWYILKKDTGKGTNVFSSMIYNQLSIVMTAIMCGLGALILTNPSAVIINDAEKQWMFPAICGVLLLVITIISILLLNHRTGAIVIRILGFILKIFPAKLNRKGQEVIDQIVTFQSAGWRFHLLIAFINIAGTFAGGMIIYMLAARGANIIIPIWVFMWLWSLIYILGRLPISIANLGVREFTLVGILSIYGVEKSAALLMSVILFSGIILISLIGAIYMIAWSFKTHRKSGSVTCSEENTPQIP